MPLTRNIVAFVQINPAHRRTSGVQRQCYIFQALSSVVPYLCELFVFRQYIRPSVSDGIWDRFFIVMSNRMQNRSVFLGVRLVRQRCTHIISHTHGHGTEYRAIQQILVTNTVELQSPEHLWDHENMFETEVVRANEC